MAREFDVPLAQPEKFPIHSVVTSRAFYVLKDQYRDRVVALARQLYLAYWRWGRDISWPGDIMREGEVIDMDGDALAERLDGPEVKQRLRSEVEDALARGIFVSPMFDIDGEFFWGMR